ncbi:hypothetical protein AXZ77_2382 [Thioclava sp. ES.031]|uniref:hypothetical protein n=1 Tax=Thioclava sp. ES.031 TaxID=1798203 RepID=UPI000BFA6FC9|nr:hypothetical protein [Thioclava sp. ES.031]PFG63769.1 hypothetical protein AXZ77_2382 [Thioclava sp. ES.031]
MNAEILHRGFDGLKFTITTDIPPELREALVAAKAEAVRTNAGSIIERDGIALAVRRSGGMAFSAHTGEYGAEWYFLDPENRPKNNPGVTVDFRAFLLATGGLEAAQQHFEHCMAALGIPYAETQLRVSRVDFAIDILAPWFEPEREALVAPQGTRVTTWTGVDETETHGTGPRVMGLRAGAVANRQLVIYDKRAEVIAKGKAGWLTIWNRNRTAAGRPPLDLADPDQSRAWRFEMRLGSKQLRNRWEIRSWADLDAMVGDAFTDAYQRIRYCIVSADRNRSRWPLHELWEAVTAAAGQGLEEQRSGVFASDVKEANREEHKRMLDGQLLGLLVSRAAAEGVTDAETFFTFAKQRLATMRDETREHPVPMDERLAKAASRYRFR